MGIRAPLQLVARRGCLQALLQLVQGVPLALAVGTAVDIPPRLSLDFGERSFFFIAAS